MNTTIASLRTTVAAQAATATVQAATIAARAANGDLCPAMTISSDAHLALFAPATRSCMYMTGALRIQNDVSNGTLLAEAFQNLRVVTGELYLSNTNLASIEGAFPRLQSVGSALQVDRNSLLNGISSAFANLETVGGTAPAAGWSGTATATKLCAVEVVGPSAQVPATPSARPLPTGTPRRWAPAARTAARGRSTAPARRPRTAEGEIDPALRRRRDVFRVDIDHLHSCPGSMFMVSKMKIVHWWHCNNPTP